VPLKKYSEEFSPHTWGWTLTSDRYKFRRLVFPTHVGMDLVSNINQASIYRFPHTRGDGPKYPAPKYDIIMFSPHTWGWTLQQAVQGYLFEVFPTHVGMDLCTPRNSSQRSGFPHTRGDGPLLSTLLRMTQQFSPHTWGWTHGGSRGSLGLDVFPTHVGMDLNRK